VIEQSATSLTDPRSSLARSRSDGTSIGNRTHEQRAAIVSIETHHQLHRRLGPASCASSAQKSRGRRELADAQRAPGRGLDREHTAVCGSPARGPSRRQSGDADRTR